MERDERGGERDEKREIMGAERGREREGGRERG